MYGRRWCAINERQRRFADEYIISGNVYQSAIKAGYSEKYAKTDAHKIRENPSVKSYITERLAELEKQKIAKQDEVLQVFTSILRQEITEEVVQLDPQTGQFIKTEKKPSIAEVIKAGSELMKRYPLDLELEKLKLEIEKLKSQVVGDEEQEDKLLQFAKALNERFGHGE